MGVQIFSVFLAVTRDGCSLTKGSVWFTVNQIQGAGGLSFAIFVDSFFTQFCNLNSNFESCQDNSKFLITMDQSENLLDLFSITKTDFEQIYRK